MEDPAKGSKPRSSEQDGGKEQISSFSASVSS